MSTARDRVFAIPELLETVLLHLPLVDLLLAQRVSSTFRNGIHDSPSLQRALFLKPIDDYTIEIHGRRPGRGHCTSLPDCDRDDPGEPAAAWLTGPARWVRNTSHIRCEAVFNPLLNVHLFDKYKYKDLWTMEYDIAAQEFWSDKSDGSWRHMLLTQPPVQIMLVDTLRSCHRHVLKAEEGCAGVTLADVQKFFEAFEVDGKMADFEEETESENGSDAGESDTKEGMYLNHTEGFRVMPRSSTAAEVLTAVQKAVDPVEAARSETEEDEDDSNSEASADE